jgi:hypothetical protein
VRNGALHILNSKPNARAALKPEPLSTGAPWPTTDEKASLMRHDDPRQLNQADHDVAFNPAGDPFQVWTDAWMQNGNNLHLFGNNFPVSPRPDGHL